MCIRDRPGSPGQAILAPALQQQGGLGKPAVLHHGLADFFTLAVKVLDPAPREDQVGIGLELAAGPALALLGGLVKGQLVLEEMCIRDSLYSVDLNEQ